MEKKARRQALTALLLVLLPNLLLTGLGLAIRRSAQQVAHSQAAGDFGPARFLRQVGLQLFFVLPMGLWLWRRGASWRVCGLGMDGVGWAVAVGTFAGAAVLLVRVRPLAAERLRMDDTWWGLATYAAVALTEEILYRGYLQGRLMAWLGRWAAYVATALIFTVAHIPARLLGGEPLVEAIAYASVRLLPMALMFGAAVLAARHVAASTLIHLAWNWASLLRDV